MLLNHYKKSTCAIILILLMAFSSCSARKSMMYSNSKVPSGSKVAVIIDSPNNIKNVILISFMKKGFQVKAFNAADLYTMKDVYDISDLKKLSYDIADDTVSTVEKTYDNIYKLHIYNFELNKAEFLKQIRAAWDVDYLILLDYSEWEKVSWARVINLKTYDIDFVENYATTYTDNVETITDHFISSISGK